MGNGMGQSAPIDSLLGLVASPGRLMNTETTAIQRTTDHPRMTGMVDTDIGDTHHICMLIYNERYMHQPDGHNQQQDNLP